MARYIDADALEKEGWHMQRIRQEDYRTMVLETKKPSEFPTADVVERNKSEWIKIDKYDKESNVQCSVCFEEFDYIDGVCYLCHGYELPLFCPNCGADMRKEVEG